MQPFYKSHSEKLALVRTIENLKEQLRTTEEIQHMRFAHNNARSWDIAINNFQEAIFIIETRY